MAYRWTRHRVFDSAGNDKAGLAAISLLSVARAAAEETLQGSPLVSAWLKLFSTQVSLTDRYWLRWRGDLAESAELRRAYSGLYGRFFARALLTHHLGLTRFLSLKRNGLAIPGSVHVERQAPGDIPDWIAWDDRASRFVLCEAKGSLTSNDFLSTGGPKCAHDGKSQFERVRTFDGTTEIHPAKWVAATRWATDHRRVNPTTILWDPPSDYRPFSREDADRHRAAISRAWLASIAPGLGWRSADDLLSKERSRQAVVVTAKPGPVPPEMDWPQAEDVDEINDLGDLSAVPQATRQIVASGIRPRISRGQQDNLTEANLYYDRAALEPRPREKAGYEGAYLISLITRFGVRPIRTNEDFDLVQREQDRARRLEEPAMLVGLPIGFDPQAHDSGVQWMDDAGIAAKNDLAVFDLRMIATERLETRLSS
jgi:hypothetical protein